MKEITLSNLKEGRTKIDSWYIKKPGRIIIYEQYYSLKYDTIFFIKCILIGVKENQVEKALKDDNYILLYKIPKGKDQLEYKIAHKNKKQIRGDLF